MSTIKVNSIEPANAGSEDYFLARAWVNFNGTGTVAIRDSGNVSSITDNGSGDYTLNYGNALSTANYFFVCGSTPYTFNANNTILALISGDYTPGAQTKTTSQTRMGSRNTTTGSTGYDMAELNAQVTA